MQVRKYEVLPIGTMPTMLPDKIRQANISQKGKNEWDTGSIG